MQVSKKVQSDWKMLREHKDIAQIIKDNPGKGFTRYLVRVAMTSGTGHFELVKAIQKFYNNRKKQMEKIS